MHKILIAILLSMLFAEMAFGHFYVGGRKDAKKSVLDGKTKEKRVNYDIKNTLRKADADLLGIREMLHTLARQEKRDRGENSWRQDRDEEEDEYHREVEAEREASHEDYARLNWWWKQSSLNACA